MLLFKELTNFTSKKRGFETWGAGVEITTNKWLYN